MSQNVRQNNLFAAEDFTKIYKSFQNVDFKVYDLESIQQSLVDNLRLNYPETFNDFIQSSEFIAHIRLLSYIASSLAFRSDLNARENILDTAERRESVIRLAKMVNYYPSRNVPLSGVAKVVAIETNEPIYDSVGRPLQNATIFWDDPNNKDSYDHFITIMNSVLATTNPFGKPYKKTNINGIQTSVYQTNNVKDYEIAYPFNVPVEGKSLPFEVVNVDINDQESFIEKHPNPQDAFNLLYRIDGQGLSSANTGFFVYFKQGKLLKKDFIYELPIKNRVTEIDIENVNETDVYVQEVNQAGDVLVQWDKIDNVNGGTNLIYNSVNLNKRNIFSVTSDLNDKIKIQYTDGNFGNVPTGIFRVWARASANKNVSIKPEQMQQQQISIPYINAEGKQYVATLTFSLQYTVNNASATETLQQVKLRAPQSYYTQNRMVNNEDYNVYPLINGNEILKVRTVNRTHAGHSRYIDINDPTGFHNNLLIYSDDGAIYKDDTIPYYALPIDTTIEEDTQSALADIQTFLKNKDLNVFFYDVVLNQYKKYKQDTFNSEIGDIYNRFNVFELVTNDVYKPIYFQPSPISKYDNVGMFVYDGGQFYDFFNNTNISTDGEEDSLKLGRTYFLAVGSKVKLVSPSDSNEYDYVTIKSVYENESNNSVFVFDKPVQNGWVVTEILPRFDVSFGQNEMDQISSNLKIKNNFSLYYDLDQYDAPWKISNTYNQESEYLYSESGINWLLVSEFTQNLTNNKSGYKLSSRGLEYIFESYKDVRFYFDEAQYDYDAATGKSLRDTIEITTQNTLPVVIERWQLNSNAWVSIDNTALTYPNTPYIPLISREITDDKVTYECIVGNAQLIQVINGMAEIRGANVGDIIQFSYTDTSKYISKPYIWDVFGNVYQEDGYQDQSKAIIIPSDTDNDGVPDVPFMFNQLSSDEGLVFLEQVTEYEGYISNSLWNTTWLNFLNKKQTDISFTYEDMTKSALFLVDQSNTNYIKSVMTNLIIDYILGSNVINSTQLNLAVDGSVIYNKIYDNGVLLYKNTQLSTVMECIYIDYKTLDNLLQTNEIYKQSNNGSRMPTEQVVGDVMLNPVSFLADETHFVKSGRSTSLNLLDQGYKLNFKWSHYAPVDNRVDPSTSNIMDMIILTNSYYREMLIWKNKRGSSSSMPKAPTSEELRLQFSDFNNYKMQSDNFPTS